MIALGSDHGGLDLKAVVKEFLTERGISFEDCGTYTGVSVDYPDFGEKVAQMVSLGQVEKGILVCGTGIGMSIVANKHNGVRAAECTSEAGAELARKHNDANILCFGERLVSWETAEAMIQKFLTTPFEEGRHTERVNKIHRLTGC